MIIWWDTMKGSGGGGGVSIDPGIENVLAGVAYEIDNVPLVGTLNPVTNILSEATLVAYPSQFTLSGDVL